MCKVDLDLLFICRDEVCVRDRELEEVKVRLRQGESGGTDGEFSGLCVKCAQNTAILPQHLTQQHVDKLTR
jgi:hypothetical protein